MKCRTFSSFISQYLDNRLENKAIDLMEKHMADCSCCRARLEHTRKLRELMARMPEKPLPDTLHQKIMGSISTRNTGRKWHQKPLCRRALIPVAAAFITLFLGLSMIRPDISLLTKYRSVPCESSYVAEDQEGSTRNNYTKGGKADTENNLPESFSFYYYAKYGALLIGSLTSVFLVYDWIKSRR